MASTITYKGEVITNVTNDTKKLLTKQKYCEDDITITDISGEVVPTQTKSKTYTSNQTDTIYPDAGYNLSQVDITVNVPTGGDIESRISRTYNSNGTYQIDPSEDYDGIEGADIVVNVPVGGDIQNSKTSSYTNNGTYHIYPDEGYDGIYDNTVTINVPAGGNVEPTRTVTYTTNGTRNITPASGYDSIEGVNINVNVPNVLEYVPQETKTGVTNTAIEIDNFAEIELPTEQNLVYGDLTEVGGGEGHDIPSIYQEVEYIQSNGTQLIELNYNMNTITDKILVDYDLTRQSGSHFVFGSYDDNQNHIGLNMYNTTTDTYIYCNTTSSTQLIIDRQSIKNRTKIEFTRTSVLVNDSRTISINGESFTDSYNMFIFGGNNGNNNKFLSTMKLYSFIVERNNEKLIELVPCYRKSDNKTGLYDIINHVFYNNVTTGEFTYGNPIDPPKTPSNPSTITVPIIDSIVTDDNNVEVTKKLAKINNVKDYLEFNSGDTFVLHKNIEHIHFTGTGIETSRELSFYDGSGNYISNVGGEVEDGVITFSEPIPIGTVVDIYYTRLEEDLESYHVTGFHNTPSDSLNITTTDSSIQLPITLTYYKDWRI